jgi:CMP-N,N'-diacetyllegionaminic acid synthase
MEKYVAIIPAREGSKTIKNKNLVNIKKKRIIDYTIQAAKKTKEISKIVITTDIKSLIKNDTDREIFIRRPKKLAGDFASTESALFHSLNYLKKKKIFSKNLILLQPTSPFRTHLDISKSIRMFERNKLDTLFSGFEEKFLMWKLKKNKYLPLNYNLKNRKRKQDSEAIIIENGAIFIFDCKKFLKVRSRLFGKIGCYIMSKRNSLEIDELYDLNIARKI